MRTTYNYWQGTRGTIIVSSDGRQANTVFGDGVNADGEIVGSKGDGYMEIHDKLMEELWREPNSGDVDPSLVELGAQCVPDDIIEVHGFTEKAILAYVGETI